MKRLRLPPAEALAAGGLFLACWALIHRWFWAHGQLVDWPTYRDYGDAILHHGLVPYRDFAVEYPGVGDGFIEVHHRAPLADRAPEGSKTKLEDLALVCANCHRMLHRNELISIDGLRAIARAR